MADGSSDIDFQDSWQTDIAAHTIDRVIGLGLVPATVAREVVDGKVGSLQWFVEVMSTEAERLEQQQNPRTWKTGMSKTVDRHLKNILVTKEFTLRLIDHSRAFRVNRSPAKPELLTRLSRTLLDGLPKLEKKDLQKQVGKYLMSSQIDRLLSRRDAILALTKKRISDNGEATVLYK